MRVRARLLNSFYAVVAVSLLSSVPALAKEPTAQEKKAATDGFKSCHEQETYGDATSCWRVWFDKYEHTGTEAEVLFAQERLKRAGITPKPTPAPDSKPPAGAATPPATTPPPSGTQAKPQPSPDTVTEVPSAATSAPATAAAVPFVMTVSGPNLCEQKPNPAATGFSKKRAVIFAPAGADSIESDPGIKRVGGAQQLREVFLQRFPLDRFSNLTTTLSGQAGWEVKPSLSKDEVKQYITSATNGDNAALGAQLAQSVDCADFLVFPAITAHTVKPLPAGKGAPLELDLDGQLGIFKATDAGFELVTTLTASVPGYLDRAQDAAATQAAKAMSSATASANGALAKANKVGDQANKVANQAQNAANQAQNAVQSAGDAAGNLANGQLPGAVGTGAGTGSGADSGAGGIVPTLKVPEIKNPLADMHERMSDACTKAKTPDETLICEVRVRAYQLSWHFRDDAVSVEGWQMVAPLRFGANGNTEAPAISLGKEESLKVGQGFVANDPNGERLGYFKVVRVGPGGSAGESEPSELNLRMGTATEGMQLREYHVWGLELSAHAAFEALVLDSAQHYVLVSGNEYATYKLPTIAFGGGGSIGYDLSGLLSSTETRLRLRLEYLSGTGTGTSATVMPIDLSFEKGFYLGKGLNFFLGVGPTLSLVSLKVALPLLVAGQPVVTEDLSAKRFGGELDAGLDVLLSPRLALRFTGIFRYNLGSSYSIDGVSGNPWADTLRDSFSTLGLNAGLNFTL